MRTVNPLDSLRAWRWAVWLACAALFLLAIMAMPTLGSAGCLVTFRHGEAVRADRCEDLGEAMAYLRFGGWVVVLKSSLVSIQDETGVTQLFPPWTPEEARAQLQGLPKEGGVPVSPPPEAAPPPPFPQPTVVYYPVPVPVPSQPVYQLPPPPPIYPGAVVFCPHCFPRHAVHPKPIPVRVVPTSPSDIGPMAIQKTFPPISPIRSR